MYDEFERAMTGRTPRKGMSILGWLAAGFAFVFMVGVVGAAFAVNRTVHRVRDEFVRNYDVASGLKGLAGLADTEAQTRLLSMDPAEGLDFLSSLDGENPAEAFTEAMVRGGFDLSRLEELSRRGDGRASLSAEDVRVDLDKARDGGSLVIQAGDEEIRFDVGRTDGGGFLTIASPDGQTRINLVGQEDGGYLSIDSDDGNVRFDLRKQGDGGQLVIRTDDETVRLGVGDGAEDMPGWVPAFGLPPRPRPVYSLDSEEGVLGAVAWETDATPAEVLSGFFDELEAQGYEVQDRYRHTDDGSDEASFWARNTTDHRMVFVVAHQEQGDTQVLLGYGQEG